MSKVIHTIRKGGDVHTEVKGVPGQRCTEASQPGLDAVGGNMVSDTTTEEMHQVVDTGIDQNA